MFTEIVVLFAGRTFGGTTHVTRFDLMGSEESVTLVTLAYSTQTLLMPLAPSALFLSVVEYT